LNENVFLELQIACLRKLVLKWTSIGTMSIANNAENFSEHNAINFIWKFHTLS